MKVGTASMFVCVLERVGGTYCSVGLCLRRATWWDCGD